MNNMNEKKLLNLDDITTTEDFLTYFSQYMPSGNYETESLYEKLQKKTLTHGNLRFRFGTSREEHGGCRYGRYLAPPDCPLKRLPFINCKERSLFSSKLHRKRKKTML